MRAGSRTLLALADPTNLEILRELAESGARSPGDIDGETGDAALYELTESGHEQLSTAAALEEWLARAPGGAIRFGSADWQRATRTLVAAWSTGVIHRLAARPHSFEELADEVEDLDAATLTELLSAMHGYDLLEEVENDYDEALYAPTQWLREAVAPLAIAVRGERRCTADEAPPLASAFDTVAMFQLILPMIHVAGGHSGSCRLSVTLDSETGLEPAGVIATVDDGSVEIRSTRLEEDSDAWVSGDREAWSNAAIDNNGHSIVIGGDEELARAVLAGFYETLFAGIP